MITEQFDNLNEIINQRLKILNEKDILEIYENDKTKLRNLELVIRKINRDYFGAVKIGNEKNNFKYEVIYITHQPVLSGCKIFLHPELSCRNELTLSFSFHIHFQYKILSPVDIFQTYQNLQYQLLEYLGYATYGTDVIEEMKRGKIKTGKKAILRFEGEYLGIIFLLRFKDKEVEIIKNIFKKIVDFKINIFDSPGSNYIYLMFDKHRKEYKIGKSIDPIQRLLQHKTSNPSIEMISYWKCSSKVETFMKKVFSNKNTEREWFILNDEDLEEFFTYMKFLSPSYSS